MRAESGPWAQGMRELRYFDDWPDFISRAKRVDREAKVNQFGGMSCASLDTTRGSFWSGTNTLKEAIDLAEHGWEEGRLKFQALRDKFSIQDLLPHARRIEILFDVTGNEPDIDRYLRNEPEQMFSIYPIIQAQHGKVLKFILNRAASAETNSERILRRGVATLLAFEALRVLGYSIELTMTICVSDSKWRNESFLELYIPILHAGDPFSLDTLAFVFMHPSVLRRLGLAAFECESGRIREQFGLHTGFGGCYGTPQEPCQLPDRTILMGWEDGLVNNDRDIIPFAKKLLRSVGIEVKEEETQT